MEHFANRAKSPAKASEPLSPPTPKPQDFNPAGNPIAPDHDNNDHLKPDALKPSRDKE
jgi:hypothetical protein